jgi:hypothetical protein
MTTKEIITATEKMVRRSAYEARVFDALHDLGFDANMMRHNRDLALGAAFGAMDLLTLITGKAVDEIYDEAVDEASRDIAEANCDVVALLNLAGFYNEAYREVTAR